MAYYPDLTPFVYGGAEPDPAILNIGWLCSDHAIAKAVPDAAFVAALAKIAADPINLYRGSHLCDFCPHPPTILSPGGIPMLDSPRETRGNGEIRVEGQGGLTYVAPALIHHYVVAHHYAPPQAFIDALMAAR